MQEFERPGGEWPENVLRENVEITIGILEAIPDMPAKGIATGFQLDAIDKPRRDRIDYLVELAEEFVQAKLDPAPAVYGALPFIKKLFGGQLDYYLKFASANYRDWETALS